MQIRRANKYVNCCHNETQLIQVPAPDSVSSGISTDPRSDLINTECHLPDTFTTGQEHRHEPLAVDNDLVAVDKVEYVYPPPIIANPHDGIFPDFTNHIKQESIESENDPLLTNDKGNMFAEDLNFIDEAFLRDSLEANDANYATVKNTFLPSPSSDSDSDSYITLDPVSRSSSPGSSSDSDTSSIQNTECTDENRLPELRPPVISSTYVSPNFYNSKPMKVSTL